MPDSPQESLKSHYYRNRYYHPQLQRFVSEDPLNLASIHISASDEIRALVSHIYIQTQFPFSTVYTFVDNNPLLYQDPLGLAPSPAQVVSGVIAGATGGSIGGVLGGSGLETSVGGLFGAVFGTIPAIGPQGAVIGLVTGVASGVATEGAGNPRASLGQLAISGFAGGLGGMAGGYFGGYRGAIAGAGIGIVTKNGLQCLFSLKKC